MNVLTMLLFLPTLAAVVAVLGVLAWPRRTRPHTSRSVRDDLKTGVAVLRGAGETNARVVDRYLDELRLKTAR